MPSCPHGRLPDLDGLVRAASERERAETPLPPGPKGRRFRNLHSRLFHLPDFFADLHRRYGGLAFFRMPHENACAVFDPDLVAALQATEGGYFRQGVAAVKIPLLEHSWMQASHGEAHRWRSAHLRPAFAEGMDCWSPMMIDKSVALLDSWRPGDVVDTHPAFMAMMSDLMANVIFGPDLEPDPEAPLKVRDSLKWEGIAGVLPLTEVFRRLPIPGILRARRRFADFDRLIDRAIRRSRDPEWRGGDLISRVVRGREGERPFTDRELRDELYGFLIGIMGPVAYCLSWCIDFLAWSPADRQRLEREVADVLGGGPVEVTDRERLPWTLAVLKESLRLSPIALADKKASADLVFGGCLIPAGTRMLPSVPAVHRSERFFERPEEFRPERWLAEGAPPPAHAYQPFGYGFRICLGDEFSVRLGVYFLAALAQRWRLQPLADGPARPDGRMNPMPYRIEGGLRVRVEELT